MTRYYSSIALLALLLVLAICITASAGEPRHCASCGRTATLDEKYCSVCGAPLPPLTNASSTSDPDHSLLASPAIALGDSAILSRLSDEELRRLVDLLLERRVLSAQPCPDSNSVVCMTRAELEQMIRKIIAEQPRSKEPSGFSNFLQYIGGGLLVLLLIAMIGTL